MAESPESSNIFWEIARYLIVAVGTVGLIWYYFFYTPVEFATQEHFGQTMGTHYQVKAARFPSNADWNEVTTAIQHRLDTLSDTSNGLAVDRIAEMLEIWGLTDYFIEVGTISRAGGKKGPNRDEDWTVAIEKPTQAFTGIQQTFALNNQSLAKSGTRDSMSVAVLAPTAVQAENWMNQMLELGEQEGLEFANQQGIAVVFLRLAGNDVVVTRSQSAM